MAAIAYLRVSKHTQDANNQRLAILELSLREQIRVDEFIEVNVSSRRSTEAGNEWPKKLVEGWNRALPHLSSHHVSDLVQCVTDLYKRRLLGERAAHLSGMRSGTSRGCFASSMSGVPASDWAGGNT